MQSMVIGCGGHIYNDAFFVDLTTQQHPWHNLSAVMLTALGILLTMEPRGLCFVHDLS
jgi:hypothetical protein